MKHVSTESAAFLAANSEFFVKTYPYYDLVQPIVYRKCSTQLHARHK